MICKEKKKAMFLSRLVNRMRQAEDNIADDQCIGRDQLAVARDMVVDSDHRVGSIRKQDLP